MPFHGTRYVIRSIVVACSWQSPGHWVDMDGIWEWAGWAVALIASVVAIRTTIRFDVNEWLRDRRKHGRKIYDCSVHMPNSLKRAANVESE